MTANSILIRRYNCVDLTAFRYHKDPISAHLVAALNANLQGLGYTMSADMLAAVSRNDTECLVWLHRELVTTLSELRGVKRYNPMYPNFPQQVMEASDAELYVNALVHYLTVWVSDVTGADCIWLPKYEKKQRAFLDEKVELTVLRLGDITLLPKLVKELAGSNTSLSETDKNDLRWLLENQYGELPAAIPNKENLAVIAATIPSDPCLVNYFKNATDVLRLAVALSGGDVSLAENTKFISFPRKQRKLILRLLEGCKDLSEAMQRRREVWLRLGERLHSGEYEEQFPLTARAFESLQEGEKVETFHSRVETAIAEERISEAVRLLVKRPGEFARRLDHLLREAVDLKEQVRTVNAFSDVADEVSTPVLLQLMAHFENRYNRTEMRVCMPKGNVARVSVLDPPKLGIPDEVSRDIIAGCGETLVNRFSTLPKLGRVYIDPALKDCLIPFSQRSASAGLRTLVRGSRLHFGFGKDTLRFFIWWKDICKGGTDIEDYDNGRVDIDLSAVMYNSKWEFQERVAYTNLRSRDYHAYHSGDITSAPNGACEFIDVDLTSLKKRGRYVAMCVNSFTKQKFSEMPECIAGWMLREKPQSGEIFDARTVVDRIQVTTAATMAVPLIVDAEERKVIWCDAAVSPKTLYNNVDSNKNAISILGKAFTAIKKPDLYTLFDLHAWARGTRVDREEQADISFSVKAGDHLNLEKIASEFLQDVRVPVTV